MDCAMVVLTDGMGNGSVGAFVASIGGEVVSDMLLAGAEVDDGAPPQAAIIANKVMRSNVRVRTLFTVQ